MTHTDDIDALTDALNTPPVSPERAALEAKWANHYGLDGTIHPTITTGCMFGSALRDDVCHPRVPPAVTATPQPPDVACVARDEEQVREVGRE